MMKKSILTEVIPLAQSDCFTIFSRTKTAFDFPLHNHEEFELNYIYSAKGAKRVVGDHTEEIDDYELVLVGANLPHTWFTNNCKSREILQITIQFHKDLFDEKFLHRNQLSFIRSMFEKSSWGILFSQETVQLLSPRIMELNKKRGFDAVLELMSLLHDLSTSKNMRVLSNTGFNVKEYTFNSRRVEKTFEYLNKNFHKTVSLGEVSRISGMSEVSFSRYFKSQTGNTFIDSLTEIRLRHASRMLTDTTQAISEIAYHCGFNNISNFNRIFKKKKGCTPNEFRISFSGTRIFI